MPSAGTVANFCSAQSRVCLWTQLSCERHELLASGNAGQDTHTYHTLDLAFHNLLAQIHGNQEMARSLKLLWNKMYRLSRRIHQRQIERLSVNVEQHDAIVNAICAQRSDEAASAMENHLIWGRTYALDPEGRLAQN